MKLTTEQKQFATATKDNLLVLAAAGAGKTGTVVHFIADKMQQKILPSEIVSFSFTKKASNELKERVDRHFKHKNYEFNYISTVHSFCWNEIIKPAYGEIRYTAIPTIIYELPQEFLDTEHKVYNARKKEKGVFGRILTSEIQQDLQQESPQLAATGRLILYLTDHNLITFDTMIPIANTLLSDSYIFDNFIRTKIKKLKYVIIDEAQDLNRSQYKFLKLLVENYNQDNGTYLVFVGDFKQSIYGFRGSEPKLIDTFINEFSPQTIILPHNFRSAQEIVDYSNEFAEILEMPNEMLELSRYAKYTQTHLEGSVEFINGHEGFLEELKYIQSPLDQTCILTRTNTLLRSIAKILHKLKIPYYLHTEYDILKKQEVKILMDLLTMISRGYNRSIILDIIRKVKGGVPLKISTNMIKCTNMHQLGHMFQDIKGIPQIVHIYSMLEQNKFDKAFSEIAILLNSTSGEKKDTQNMITSMERFHNDLKTIKKENNLSSWVEALDEMLFEAQFLEEKTKGKVQLMTVHKSKGLQWENVLFLYDYSILDLEEDKQDFYKPDEEKRIIYTAITRPVLNLSIWDLSEIGTNINKFFQTTLPVEIDREISYGNILLHEFEK